MQNRYKSKKYMHRDFAYNPRDLKNQNFDNLDAKNEFTSIKVINEYRRIGEELMRSINYQKDN